MQILLSTSVTPTYERHAATHTPNPAARTAEDQLGSYLAAARETARKADLPAGWCVIASRLTARVLPTIGYRKVQTVGVQMAVLNPAASTLMRRGVPAQLWPDAAWSGGIEGTGVHHDDGWDGHVVSIVRESRSGRGRLWLLDPSADQVNRPGRGVALLPMLSEVDETFLLGQPARFSTDDGSTIIYRREPGLEATAHVRAYTDKVLIPTMEQDVRARLGQPQSDSKRDLRPAR